MGYGSRAVELLFRFYNGEMVSLANADDEDDSEGSDDEEANETEEETRLAFGRLTLDQKQRILFNETGTEIALTNAEYRLLDYFALALDHALEVQLDIARNFYPVVLEML